MSLQPKKVKAWSLCSCGMDSNLSALVLRRQGIEVEWVTFETPFFSSEKALKAGQINDIPVTVKNITPVYLEMLKNPACGYGKYMNPCPDCHALMFKLAGKIMKEKEFDFLFSGEVLGQRPMSQTKSSLRYVEKHSGYDGYILRPLSAKRLPVTVPEKIGLVKRDLLFDITGRSRKSQIKLAEEFGLTTYPAPAGGCRLTDKEYAVRLKDLFQYQNTYSERELRLLKYGRHFRLNRNIKIVVGRSKSDNENINKNYSPYSNILINLCSFPGPTVLMLKTGSKENVRMAASICAGYSKAPSDLETDVLIVSPHNREIINVIGIPPEKVKHMLI